MKKKSQYMKILINCITESVESYPLAMIFSVLHSFAAALLILKTHLSYETVQFFPQINRIPPRNRELWTQKPGSLAFH